MSEQALVCQFCNWSLTDLLKILLNCVFLKNVVVQMLCTLQQEKEGGRGGWHGLGPGDLLAPSAPALKFGVIRSLGLPPHPHPLILVYSRRRPIVETQLYICICHGRIQFSRLWNKICPGRWLDSPATKLRNGYWIDPLFCQYETRNLTISIYLDNI